ncbi:thioredoxin family protein [uncultured Roseivirga sp.]|uniref:thioredoxin family protein n=1 Tax=uncultured Roseivirga sp. TaxID=543088 RepID=UPI0030D814C9|tara:strand:- start:56979 stop:57860 length:882 start_codon:yes stop_codon:yes gene_type:complete
MKPLFSLLFTFFILSTTAQEVTIYKNQEGESHLAGKFPVEYLQQDSTYRQWFNKNYAEFTVEKGNDKWKKALKNTQVDIYLGTWCGDSQKWVPSFLKLWDELGLDRKQLSFTALYDGEEKYKQGPNEEEKGKKIHRVPTFIFNNNGEEYARIVETPRNDLKTDLAQIALGYPSEPNYRAATYLLDLFEENSMTDIYKDANTHLNEVYHLVGKSGELHTLGRVLMSSNRVDQGLLVLQFNTIINPYTPSVLNRYGNALAEKGQKETAISTFEKVLQIEPEDENALAQLKKLKEN